MGGFEQNLQQALFSGNSEKTFIDKILSRQDVEAIRELIKKPRLSRSDILELLYLISGVESKLLNYGEWDRYVILKFFVWIREFVKVLEILHDYDDDLKLREKKCTCGGYKVDSLPEGKKACTCEKPEFTFKLSGRTRQLIDNNMRLCEHNVKFLLDLYLNIGRTSLSIGASGFKELLTNKFEMAYPTLPGAAPQVEEKKGIRRFL